MPKKQTIKRKIASKKPSFAHPTRHGKMHWKKALLIILTGSFGLVLAGVITAQVMYNKVVWDWMNEHSSTKIALLIQAALEGLDELKRSPQPQPDGTMRIPEAWLVLPADTDEVRNILYFYSPSVPDPDGDGYALAMPESIQVTTRAISISSRQKLLTGITLEQVFKMNPEAQACNRGYLLQFEPSDTSLPLTGTPKLADGRTVYIYQETECKHPSAMDLRDHLLKIQSY